MCDGLSTYHSVRILKTFNPIFFKRSTLIHNGLQIIILLDLQDSGPWSMPF